MMDTSFQRLPLDLEKPVTASEESGVRGQGSEKIHVPTPDPSLQTPTQDGPVDVQNIEAKVIAALATCFDPEIPVNIYELGLVYDVKVAPDGQVRILMTLTSPACPAAASLPGEVQAKAREVPGVRDTQVELVWDPPWTPERMSEAAKLQLGFF
jgi:FeS assembly SUF system protein